MKQRLQYIDVAKGLGILLVVLGHNRSLTDGLPSFHAAIYLFHMPLFFFLSGMTAPAVFRSTQLGRRLLGLLKPYIAGVVLFLPLQLRQTNHPSNDGVIAHALWGSGNAIFNTPLWFLTALMTGYLVYGGIQWVRARLQLEHHFPFMACLLVVVSYLLMAQQIGFGQLRHDHLNRPLGAPFNIDLAPLTAGVLLLGHWWYAKRARTISVSRPALIGICILIAILFWGLLHLDPALDLNYRAVQAWPAALACCALGIAGTMSLSMLIATWLERSGCWLGHTLIFLGRNTLFILLLHAPLQNALTSMFVKHAILPSYMGMILSLTLCLILAWTSHFVVNRNRFLRGLLYV